MIGLSHHQIIVAVIAALVVAAVAGYAGYRYAAAQGEARLAQCEQARESERRQAAEATAAMLSRAQDAEADAVRRLAAARIDRDRRIKEVRRDVYALTIGRECISNDLRMRINAAIAGDDGLPARAGGTNPTVAEPAADPGDGRTSTDADIAGWIIDAAGLYDECRARIDAIRHWDEVTYGR